jgi:hypothetical protein
VLSEFSQNHARQGRSVREYFSVSLTPAQIQNIETQLATAYVGLLIDEANASPTLSVSADVSFQQALQFHSAVFSNFHLGSQTWTLYVPYEVLGQTTMEQDWEQIISPLRITDPASYTGTALLTIEMWKQALLGNDQAKNWLKEVAWHGAVDGTGITLSSMFDQILGPEENSQTGTVSKISILNDPRLLSQLGTAVQTETVTDGNQTTISGSASGRRQDLQCSRHQVLPCACPHALERLPRLACRTGYLGIPTNIIRE